MPHCQKGALGLFSCLGKTKVTKTVGTKATFAGIFYDFSGRKFEAGVGIKRHG